MMKSSAKPVTPSLGKSIELVAKLYQYVGPLYLAKLANSETLRLHVKNVAALAEWMEQQSDTEPDGTFVATFVIFPDGLWIADRHSEHVACARGWPVLSAGEMTFQLDRHQKQVQVVAVTNQSTGFCPEPESWPAVEAALDAVGIHHPGEFTTAMIFRRCANCETTNIVKDGWFECAVCGRVLPSEWNFFKR